MTEAQPSTFVFFLHRPFFDLEPVIEGPLLAQGPILAFEALDAPDALLNDKAMSEEFRLSLISESRLEGYAVLSPLELGEEHRTPRWQHLCDLVSGFEALPVDVQLRAARLLISLCFFRTVLRLIPRSVTASIEDEGMAWLAAIRAFARYVLHFPDFSRYQPYDLEGVIQGSRHDSHVRHWVASTLMVYGAKFWADRSATSRYLELAKPYLSSRVHNTATFEYHIRMSRFYRGASFLPFLEGDRRRCIEEIQRSVDFARFAPSRSERDRVIARDALGTSLESMMRVRLWVGELDEALDLAREIVELDPWDARVHAEHGELLLKTGHVEEASDAFQRSARLGPPGTAVTLYLAGSCHERLGSLERALELYLRALSVDPDGISSTLGAARTARLLNDRGALSWAGANGERLARRGQLTATELAAVRS